MAKSRWEGEWLVAVDERGRVMLPVLQPDAPQPTHYLLKTIYGRRGHIELVPMREAREDDLRPETLPATEAPEDKTDERIKVSYTPEELASLEYECPFCGAGVREGCFARPSFRPLTDYPENPTWVHKRRLNLVTFTSPEGAVTPS